MFLDQGIKDKLRQRQRVADQLLRRRRALLTDEGIRVMTYGQKSGLAAFIPASSPSKSSTASEQ